MYITGGVSFFPQSHAPEEVDLIKQKSAVLLADDEAINLNILRRILAGAYDIMEAKNGAQALEVLHTHREEIAAVILDLNMPGLDGRDFLRRVSGDPLYSNVPILVATADQSTETESSCLALGAWDFISKPYSPDILKLRLQNIIGRSQAALMEKIRLLAERDALTGIYNRTHFMERTRQMLQTHKDQRFILVRLDIDRFRMFNSFFGTAEGDELLRRIAQELTALGARFPFCTYGRMESDVFCICEPYSDKVLRSQLQELPAHIRSIRKNYCIEISFGLYVIRDTGMDMESLYACATEAAKKCKDNYNLRYVFYDASMSQQAIDAQSTINDMEQALKTNQFQVYFQPKYHLQSRRSCGAEALVRWLHPVKGLLPPGLFIPLFEQNGFILQLDLYMWKQTCKLLRSWLDQGLNPPPVSVNVSRISLHDPHLLRRLTGLVERYNIPVELLNLEITESAYMSHPELMRELIPQLRRYGFVILMDDFGSGYSSLNTLKDIEVDILKIDMKFLPTGRNNAKSEKILASITQMADWLGIPVVAEGVETAEQADFLESIGCRYVQGYYFAKPMPTSSYGEMLHQQSLLAEQPSPAVKPAEVDAFLDADPQTRGLLGSFPAPCALCEYAEGRLTLVRTNQAFGQAFPGQDLHRPGQYLSHEEWMKFQAAAESAVAGRPGACVCMFVLADGAIRWFRIKLRHIASLDGLQLLSATYGDITEERQLERHLRRLSSALHPTPAKRIMLLADGDATERERLCALFAEDFEVLPAADGPAALALLRSRGGELSLVLLAEPLPTLDSGEFLRCKNELASGIPVVAILSEERQPPQPQLSLLELGLNDYVFRPLTPEALVCRVQNALEYSDRFQAMVREFRAVQPDAASQTPQP